MIVIAFVALISVSFAAAAVVTISAAAADSWLGAAWGVTTLGLLASHVAGVWFEVSIRADARRLHERIFVKSRIFLQRAGRAD